MTICPRCANSDVLASKTTLVGKSDEAVPGVRSDDVVAYSYYCPRCGLFEEASTLDGNALDALMRRWEPPNAHLQREIAWTRAAQASDVFEADVDGHRWTLRLNAGFPRQERYTLQIDGADKLSFSHWPLSWIRPPS